MKIDSHQHFWIYDPVKQAWIDTSMQEIAKDFLPEDLNSLAGAESSALRGAPK